MSRFYQLNLAEPLLVRTGKRRFAAWASAGFLFGAAIVSAVWLFGEYHRPVARQRLSRLNDEAMRVLDLCDTWQKFIDSYKPLYPLMCRQDERSAAEFLRIFGEIASGRHVPGVPAPELGYSPVSVTAVRGREVSLEFDLPLPDYDRGKYRDAACYFFTNMVASAVASVQDGPSCDISMEWSPAIILASDKASRGVLRLSFVKPGKKNTTAVPELPAGLKEARGTIEKWHKAVFAIVPVKPARGAKPKDVRMYFDYFKEKDVRRQIDRAVDPVSLLEPVRRVAGPSALRDFNADWAAVVDARWPWRRNKVVDTPQLDSDADYLAEIVAKSPTLASFEAALAKCEVFYASVTGGVGRVHIEQDNYFRDKVLLQAFRQNLKKYGNPSVKTVGTMQVSRKYRVDFPEWHVLVEPQEGGASLKFLSLAESVEGVEGGKAGLWVTDVKALFDPKAPSVVAGAVWPGLSQIDFAGRVPCRTE